MVVVGAPGEDTGATNAGRAYVHDLSSGTPTVPVVTLNHPSPAPNDNFGGRVAISGPRVVVGTAGGSAYVYDLGNGTPAVPVFTLNNPSPALNDRTASAPPWRSPAHESWSGPTRTTLARSTRAGRTYMTLAK